MKQSTYHHFNGFSQYFFHRFRFLHLFKLILWSRQVFDLIYFIFIAFDAKKKLRFVMSMRNGKNATCNNKFYWCPNIYILCAPHWLSKHWACKIFQIGRAGMLYMPIYAAVSKSNADACIVHCAQPVKWYVVVEIFYRNRKHNIVLWLKFISCFCM